MTSTTFLQCDVPVFFATTEGHTRRIADRIVDTLRAAGLRSRAIDVTGSDVERVDWTQVRGAALGASLHAGKHQRAADRFAEAHAADLNAHPSVFFSVSLSAASEHAEEVQTARRIAEALPAAHGWRPAEIASIAGCLAYTKYGFFKRWIMKRIARKEGAPTDASRDYELTNWAAVDAVARELATRVKLEVGRSR